MTISIWILGDQLVSEHPALQEALRETSQDDLRVLMIESEARLGRKQYASKKLILLLSAMRHYAEDLRQKGFVLDYRIEEDMTSALKSHFEEHDPAAMILMAASSYRGREFQKGMENMLKIPVKILLNTMFLSNRYDPFPDLEKDKNIRQETFYRAMRQHFNLLMDEQGDPVGGQWNYDKQNRVPLPDDVVIPPVIQFEPDQITQEVIESLNERFSWTEKVDKFDLAVSCQEAQAAADDFFAHRLGHFGTYEDAMTRNENLLFHSKLAAYLNLGLLDPLELAKRAQESYEKGQVTLNNVEGFIRQVIGWREYMYWQYQRLMPGLAEKNYFNAKSALPSFFWTGEIDMNCLKHVLERSLRDGYVHHIERLMILSNFCLLTGIDPREVLHWFQALFIDAYDWVMLPNVLGMGLYADGGMIGTKPYIASANYIHKMSDYCQDCRYDHKVRTGEDACPFNFLYWNFLLKHEKLLRENHRMARMLYNLKYLDDEERRKVRKDAEKLFMR
jgi:deoxyribodipyrimidine photolyase-related protein